MKKLRNPVSNSLLPLTESCGEKIPSGGSAKRERLRLTIQRLQIGENENVSTSEKTKTSPIHDFVVSECNRRCN
ncbi:hypothetical protein VNO80_10352 [Phaseolus coccineus]|uniref:Uncharacterized protein n=1 Tax=Phaseolus coccineus TaxID=3886 RepID=A0AAN9RDR6_PHACN